MKDIANERTLAKAKKSTETIGDGEKYQISVTIWSKQRRRDKE